MNINLGEPSKYANSATVFSIFLMRFDVQSKYLAHFSLEKMTSAFPIESLICKTTAGILIVLISIVPERVALAQCPDCAGEIKRISATGQCHSCFPCPECIDGYSTSSVRCGATVLYWTDIHCVEILQHPQESSQTRHVIFATKTSLDISPTSSLVHAGSSITQNGESRSTKDPNIENKLPLLGSSSNWKQAVVYILGGISAVILFLAFAQRFQEESKGFAKPAVETQFLSTTGLYLPVTSETSLNGIPRDLQNNLLSKEMSAIPLKFYSRICTKLNIERSAFDDFRLLGEEIGLTKDVSLWLSQLDNPTDRLITDYYNTQEGSCVGKFQEILERMQRRDIIDVIDEWVKYETDECNSSTVSRQPQTCV